MYRNILLAYDGTPKGSAVLRQGAELAALCKARVCLLAVVTIPSGVAIAESIVPPDLEPETRAEVQASLDEGTRQLQARGLEVDTRLVAGEPVDQISCVAEEIGADLIVVGHKPRGPLARWWQGSVGRTLLAQTPCSLLVAVEPGSEEEAAQ